MDILKKSDLSDVVSRLEKGQIGIFPTDTVYGIVGICSPDKLFVKNKIYEIKKRNSEKPLVLQVGLKYNLLDIIEGLNFRKKRIIETFFPGALTIIFKVNKEFKSVYIWEKDTIGIRIPKNEFLLNVLDILKRPLFVTSANISGDNCVYDYEKLKKKFFNSVDFIIDEPDKKSAIPSTIVDLSSDCIKFLREGEISKQKILEIWFNE